MTEYICEGWNVGQHFCAETFTIFIHGCEHCGGGDCGDSGDVLELCQDCRFALESDKLMVGRFDVMEAEQ